MNGREAPLQHCLEAGMHALQDADCRAAVFIPLVEREGSHHVVFEVRAKHLKRQPGEVCLPGGHIEPGESAREAAIRETCEELLVDVSQLREIVDLGRINGPGGLPLRLFAGTLSGYDGSFDAEEVDSTFRVPVRYFLENDPTVYQGRLVFDPPDDLPWESIPNGRGYHWHNHMHAIPFYDGITPLIWGFTARVMMFFTRCLKAGGYR